MSLYVGLKPAAHPHLSAYSALRIDIFYKTCNYLATSIIMLHYDLNVKLKTHCDSLTLPCVSLLFFINGLAAAGSKLGLDLSQSLRNSHQEPCPAPHPCLTRELPSLSPQASLSWCTWDLLAYLQSWWHLKLGAEAALSRWHQSVCLVIMAWLYLSPVA